MTRERIPARELIRRALQDAIGWQEALADGYRHMPDAPERAEALDMARQYRRLLRRRGQVTLAELRRREPEAPTR